MRFKIAIQQIGITCQILTFWVILFAFHITIIESVYAQDADNSDIIILGDASIPLTGEQTMLDGFITDEEGSYLQGATIFLEELDRGTTTDEEGYFRLSMEQGEYTLITRYIGMETKSIRIRIHSADTLRITLAEQELDLEEVIVEGTAFGSILRRPVTGLTTSTISDLDSFHS